MIAGCRRTVGGCCLQSATQGSGRRSPDLPHPLSTHSPEAVAGGSQGSRSGPSLPPVLWPVSAAAGGAHRDRTRSHGPSAVTTAAAMKAGVGGPWPAGRFSCAVYPPVSPAARCPQELCICDRKDSLDAGHANGGDLRNMPLSTHVAAHRAEHSCGVCSGIAPLSEVCRGGERAVARLLGLENTGSRVGSGAEVGYIRPSTGVGVLSFVGLGYRGLEQG